MLLKDLIAEVKNKHGSYEKLREKSPVFSSSFLCEIIKGKWLPSEKKLIQFCKDLELDEVEFIGALRYSKLIKIGQN